jgi:HSP20 family molecular chaperone IbpA
MKPGWVVPSSFLVALWIAYPGSATPQDPSAPELSVAVVETSEEVRLRLRVPMGIDPGSLDVILNGRRVRVLAREAGTNRRIRSRELRLKAPAVEEGADAEYGADGWVTVRLRRPPSRSPTD